MTTYSKHFIPLESDPDIFNQLLKLLGLAPSLSFYDVLSLDEPTLPGPAIALILVLPTTDGYERTKTVEDAEHEEYNMKEEDDIMWFRQTINNACGLYALLHAVSNGEARNMLEKDSLIASIIKECSLLPPVERSLVLEYSEELEHAYTQVASQGISAVPENPEDEVDFHYVCFVKSQKSGRLYELDGDRKAPIDRGLVLEAGRDMLAAGGGDIIRRYMEREQGNVGFSLMALVHNE